MLRTKVLAGALAVAAASLAAPTWATAAPSSDTVVTFTITGGALDILGQATANLGTGAPGTALTGSLGDVTVTDGRALADGSWAATVTATDFVTGAGTPTETVLASLINYWSGPATATTGTGTFAGAQATAAAAAPLGTTPLAAFGHTGGTGNNTASWNPTAVVNVPLANQVGTYTGTVTHSVA